MIIGLTACAKAPEVSPPVSVVETTEAPEIILESMEVAVSDERNQFIRSKAWAWAGYLFILISAVGVFIFKLAGQDLLSQAASWSVCLMLVLYWICWTILQKKY
jgi:hypothetical protein